MLIMLCTGLFGLTLGADIGCGDNTDYKICLLSPPPPPPLPHTFDMSFLLHLNISYSRYQ
jgi:hypothetical protein